MEHAPLVVFADDWGRHPSSCQHLVRCLLDRYRVWWVNTIGTRTPRLDLDTLKRGFGKLQQWVAGAAPREAPPANLQVLNPKMWPWFTRPADRWLNRKLLARRLVPLARALPQAPVAVTTLPIVAGLMDDLPVCRWVYYCVDDFGQWPGLDQAPLREMEERLVRRADVIVAVSENLQQRLRAMGRESYLLTHGVDLDFWQARPGRTLPVLEGLQRPLIVFWGVVDRRMDVAFVRRLAEDLLRGTILLVGPEADPDPELIRTRRVARLLPLPFEDLPVLAEEAAVLVMPYADLAVTRAMQPLKLKEYLATGKPVIVRDLPATRPWADGLDLAETAEAFARAVRKRLAEGLSEEQRQARRRLAAESWTEKARLFEEWALAAAPAPSGAMSC